MDVIFSLEVLSYVAGIVSAAVSIYFLFNGRCR